jgi:hypothetical protein
MTTILFPAGTTHIRYSDMAHHIAKALHDDPWMYGAARVNLEDELAQAVMRGALLLRDPLTLGPHPMPIGAMRDAGIVLLDDLRDFLKSRGITVEVAAAQASPAPANTTLAAPELPDPERRLKRLREIGGEASWYMGKWTFTKTNTLAADEARENRPRSSQKTIKADLEKAAEAERKAKRDGAAASPFPS